MEKTKEKEVEIDLSDEMYEKVMARCEELGCDFNEYCNRLVKKDIEEGML